MKATNTTAHAAYATDALSSAAYALLGQTELPAVDVAHAMPAAELVVDLAALTTLDVPAMDAPAFAADTESAAVMAAYVPVEIVGEPSLLAQASGGLGATRIGSGQGQVVERPQNQGNDDDRGGMWWLLGGLGLLAAAGGGGGGGGGGISDERNAVSFTSYDYSVPGTTSTSQTFPDITSTDGSARRIYSGGETEFGFSMASTDPNHPELTASFNFSYDPETRIAHIYIGGIDITPSALGVTFSISDEQSFSTWLSTQLQTLSDIVPLEGSNGDITLTINGFTCLLSLDNSAGNGNLINSLQVSSVNGEFTLTTDFTTSEVYGSLLIGEQAFAAGTSLADASDLLAILSNTSHGYFVCVGSTTDPTKIDMRSDIAGTQVYVYQENTDAYCVVTLDPVDVTLKSVSQLFINGDYKIITA